MTVSEQPDSIRAYLDAGGDPTGLDGWKALAEQVAYGRFADREACLASARSYLACVDHFDADEGHRDRLASSRRRAVWQVELLEDDDLAVRFEDGLPRDVVAEHRHAADVYVRPWSVTAEAQEEPWRCAATGVEMTGPAVVLFDRENGTEPVLMSPTALADVLSGTAPEGPCGKPS
jgi:hypothetical protein